jgi:hypothetical protein
MVMYPTSVEEKQERGFSVWPQLPQQSWACRPLSHPSQAQTAGWAWGFAEGANHVAFVQTDDTADNQVVAYGRSGGRDTGANSNTRGDYGATYTS